MSGHSSDISKKVAILIPTCQKGGAEKQSILLAQLLAESHPVYFYVFYGERGIESNWELLSGNENIHLIRLKGSFGQKMLFLYTSFRKERIDCLFNYLTLPNFIGAGIGRLAGVKQIYGGIRSCFVPWHKMLAEIISARFLSTGTIFNSCCGKHYFQQKRLGKKNNLVIHNAIHMSDSPLRTQEPVAIKIVTVARFVPEKDYSTSLNAIHLLCSQLPQYDIEYIIGGYGVEERAIREKISELHLDERVHLVGNPPQVDALLEECDLYLSTSLFEGTSNSIMEAMNHRLPVVATDVGDNGVLVEDGVTGYLCEVRDAAQIAERIKQIILEKQIASMGNAGYERLCQNFSELKMKKSYLALTEFHK